MNQYISKLHKELNFKLQAIDLEETNTIKKAQKSIICIKNEGVQYDLIPKS